VALSTRHFLGTLPPIPGRGLLAASSPTLALVKTHCVRQRLERFSSVGRGPSSSTEP